MNITRKFLIFFISMIFISFVYSQQEKPDIGIEEKLGDIIPADINLINEDGQPVNLKSLINKPTILSLVYFRCSGICTPLLKGVADVIDHTDIEPGKDYDIITVSFDPTDDYLRAKEKRDNYLELLNKKIPRESWKFLTGDSISIYKLTHSVGWKYMRQENDFAHGSAIMMISPQGKIIRYLFGITYLPLDLKLAVAEAEEGKTGPSINKLLKFCYSYDPEGRKYTFNLLRIVGSGMLLTLAFIFIVLLRSKKRPVSEHPRKEI